jgi:hypothetical protein
MIRHRLVFGPRALLFSFAHRYTIVLGALTVIILHTMKKLTFAGA